MLPPPGVPPFSGWFPRFWVIPSAARVELLHVLMLPDLERADRIGEFWGYAESRNFAELLIDCEEDRTLRAVLVGMLREAERDADRALSQWSVGKHSGTGLA
jgi:hypothetical protein